MNPWALLGVAIIAELVATASLKASDGLTRPAWLVPVVLGYGGAFAALAVAMRSLPVGTAYAVWSGLGTVGALLIGLWAFGERVDVARVVGVGLVLAGVVVLHVAAAPPPTAAAP